MGFLTTSSAGASFLAGVVIITCWLIAIHDDVLIRRKCGGCIRNLRKHISDMQGGSLKNYYKLNKDAYLITFILSIIIGGFWMITGALAFVKPMFHLISGIITTIIFICTFAPLVDRMRFNEQCRLYSEGIKKNFNQICGGTNSEHVRTMKYIYSSYELFWASSMACFIFAGYQIICAIAAVYDERMGSISGKVPPEDASLKAIGASPEEKSPSKPVPDIEARGDTHQPHEELSNKGEEEQVPDDEAIKSFRAGLEEDPSLQQPGPSDSALKSYSKMVKRGELELPKESPIPAYNNPDFSLNNI